MKIHKINDLTDEHVISLLKTQFLKITKKNLLENYHPDFESYPANLFYRLKNEKYKTGNYFVLEDSGKFVASAGWNEHQKNIALLLTRAYIDFEYRRKYFLSKYFLPLMFEETKNYNKLWITCNDYNISIFHAINRLNNNQSAGLFDPWPKVYSMFKPIGKKIVNFTEQYVFEYNKDN